MKKFKNIKLMLLGLLAMGSMNAFAADGDIKTDGTFRYEVINEAKAQVALVGYSNVADANPTSITIKDVVSLQDDQLKDKDYTVVAVYQIGNHASTHWWTKPSTDTYVQNVDLAKVKEFIVNMRIDGGSSTGNDWADVVTEFLTYASALEKLVVRNAFLISNLPVLNYSLYPNLKVIGFGPETVDGKDYPGVTNGGNPITLTAGFVTSQNLTSLTLPKENLIVGDYAFTYLNNDASAQPLSIDISKAEKIGVDAFYEANVAKVTIGNECVEIGNNAFGATDPNHAYLKEIVWDNNKLLSPTAPNLPYIPAKFEGQKNINSITIKAKNVNSIEDGAFDDITGNLAVDLTGAVALGAIKNAFGTGAAAPKFTSLKLKDAPLKAANGKVSDIVDLTNSKATLTEISLPSTITTLDGVVGTESFASFTALTTLDMEKATITAIPDNGFKDCTALKSFTLPNATTTIGKYAFYNTKLEAISIPAAVTSIGEYAFAEIPVVQDGSNKWYKGITLTLADNSNLAKLGKGVFENTNIDGTVDFTKTGVKAIPEDAFAKKANFWNTSTSGWTAKYALKEVKFNAGTSDTDVASIGNNAFKNNIALATADLNKAFLTSIGASAFENTALTTVTLTDSKVKSIASSAFAGIATLTTATLNEETTDINTNAFDGDIALATVNFDKLTKLADINDYAFNQSAIKELNLKNCAALTHIGERAFGQYVKNEKRLEDSSKPEEIKATLTKITFPEEKATDPESTDAEWKDKYTNKIDDIEEAAFFAANKVTTIENEEFLKIKTLNQWFTNNLNTDIDTPADEFAKPLEQDQIRFCPDGLDEFTLPSATWKAKDKTTGYALTTVNHYALQGLGISEIAIPATVTEFGGCVLQGCLELTKFEYRDCAPQWPYVSGSVVKWYDGPGLHKYTFRGNSNLAECRFETTDQIASGGLTDNHFFWCSKEKLQVYVTAESLLQLQADGYTTANAKYSKLNDKLETKYAFKDAGLNAKDGFYYATYWNDDYSTWFAEGDVEVFTAVVKGNQIEMVPAEVENGFYKIKKRTCTKTGDWKDENGMESLCIIRSKEKEVDVTLNAILANNISTLAKGQNDLQYTADELPVSKLTYQFKLGRAKDGSVGFFRIKTGSFKAKSVFIQASSPARFDDFIEINGDATGIKMIEAAENEDGAIYNLQGIRVNETQKGMFIKNGKKFIVK